MDRTKKDVITSIIGLGLDSADGHVRFTEGDHFKIHAGSEESHALMQDLCIRINQELDRRGQILEQLSRKEFVALLRDLNAID